MSKEEEFEASRQNFNRAGQVLGAARRAYDEAVEGMVAAAERYGQAWQARGGA